MHKSKQEHVQCTLNNWSGEYLIDWYVTLVFLFISNLTVNILDHFGVIKKAIQTNNKKYETLKNVNDCYANESKTYFSSNQTNRLLFWVNKCLLGIFCYQLHYDDMNCSHGIEWKFPWIFGYVLIGIYFFI